MSYKKYNNLIRRKLGEITLRNLSKYSHFSEDKEKEIIVWLRMQEGLDKQQYLEFIIDKFHTSFQDAEKMYYKAFPEGIGLEESTEINVINNELSKVNPIDVVNFLDDTIEVVINKEYSGDSPEIVKAMARLLKNRDLIK